MTQVIDSAVSDLFFSVDNNIYWKSLETNKEEALKKLRENAQDFCDSLKSLGVDVEPEDVVQDFLERS